MRARISPGAMRGPVCSDAATTAAAAWADPPQPQTLQEVEGLRNQYLDSFLPPRRTPPRRAPEPGPPRTRLHFPRFPIVDLDTPAPELCAPRPCLWPIHCRAAPVEWRCHGLHASLRGPG